MKKILLIFLLILFINASLYVLLLPQTSPFKDDVIRIAVAVPDTETRKEVILHAVRLYVNEINRQGGVDGRETELLVYDDMDDKETAEKVATQIADENKALLVIGHYNSGTSIAAGKIYKKNEIPAITASATSEPVTLENDWYFRIVPNNTVQSEFIANYVNKSLRKSSASLVFSNGSYGSSLGSGFEKAAERLGMEIDKVELDENDNLENQVRKVVDELIAAPDPEILCVSMSARKGGAEIICQLRLAGKTYPIICCESFAGDYFLREIKKYPPELSNGILFASPFMKDIVSENVYHVRKKFSEKYGEDSLTWVAAGYYDAAHVAIEAIKNAGIQGEGYIRNDRRKVRNALADFFSEKSAVKGITGDIFFDKNGDVNKPYAMGMYRSHERFPSFSQYKQIANVEYADNLFQKIINNEIMMVGEKFVRNIGLVYVGLDIVDISNINLMDSVFTSEFYIWFRYSANSDDIGTNIKFRNAAAPIELGEPIRDETKNGVTTRVYHVKADFKHEFDVHDYPFGYHVLPIRFHNATLRTDRLIYVPDKNLFQTATSAPDGWQMVGTPLVYSDVTTKKSTLGNPKFFNSDHTITYSQINAKIRIERENLKHFIFEKFYPIIIMVLILYIPYFIPPKYIGFNMLIIMILLYQNTKYYLETIDSFIVVYITALGYAFFVIYGLATVSVFIFINIQRLHVQGDSSGVKLFTRLGRIVYPSLVLMIGFLYGYIYLL